MVFWCISCGVPPYGKQYAVERDNQPMSKAGKIIIAIAVAFFILIAGVMGFGVYWWSHHKNELLEAGKKQMDQGKEFGKKTDEQGCLDEAIARYKANRGFTGSLAAGLFLRTCLEASRPTQGFCDHVPKTLDIVNSVRWQLAESKRLGIDDDYGRQLLSQVQQYCESREAKSKSR
jgi:hypothetical protein